MILYKSKTIKHRKQVLTKELERLQHVLNNKEFGQERFRGTTGTDSHITCLIDDINRIKNLLVCKDLQFLNSDQGGDNYVYSHLSYINSDKSFNQIRFDWYKK